MAIAKKIDGFMEKASWIRKMFEEGMALKQKFGAENVFDFSLGNPNLDPPAEFFDALKEVVAERTPGAHAYMSNAGYPETRAAVAQFVSAEQGVELSAENVLMTCGAGGGLNVVFRTLLDPGDEVLVPTPFFVEYRFYVDNHSGICRLVESDDDFSLNLKAIEEAISEKTKIVLVNSPNNPTGKVYDSQAIEGLGELLRKKSSELGRTICLMSDEPYRKIVFDGVEVPSILSAYDNSLVVTSYSKDLSLPGERLGFIAVNPAIESIDTTMNGLVFSNRTLGFVNAPALMQRVAARVQGVSVDASVYQRKRDLLCGMLSELGYEFVLPGGAFYLFPKSPIDDVEFVKELQAERILVVPGSGFGRARHFRISYCVADETIERSRDGFARVAERHFS
jgi:aspartate aminotransferase